MYEAGDIVTVNLEPAVGSEQGPNPSSPLRPCLVVATTKGHCPSYFDMVTIVPFTTKGVRHCGSLTPVIPTPTPKDPSARSLVLVPQVRSIDPKRIRRTVSRLGPAELATVQQALREFLNLAP